MAPGLLAVQIVIGWEFLLSGLTKVRSSKFVDGLQADLEETSADAPGWYRSFLEDVVYPNDELFGWLTQVGELLIGIVLIGAALALLVAHARLGKLPRIAILFGIAAVAFGAALLTFNAHYASAESSPFALGDDPFDETVDLDSLMTAIELILAVVALRAAVRLRREPAEEPLDP